MTTEDIGWSEAVDLTDIVSAPTEEEMHPLWKSDRVLFRSVGVDIGSATTHLAFSTIEMRRQSSALSSRFALTARHVDYSSDIFQTPFLDRRLLDEARLTEIINNVYRAADVTPDQLHTGAVITTGDAARKENADTIAHLFASSAGKFVCATSGPALETRLAAHGSGAVRGSRDGASILNIDIGGGTTKIALCKDGEIETIAAINIGARLLTMDGDQKILTIENGGALTIRAARLALHKGDFLHDRDRIAVCARMADALLSMLSGQPTALANVLIIIPFNASREKIDGIFFSGGVAEYILGHEARTFGDLGPVLAASMAEKVREVFPDAVIGGPPNPIRATVIGASQFSTQVSGNTIHLADRAILPLRNVPVICIDPGISQLEPRTLVAMITEAAVTRDLIIGSPMALAVKWKHGPSFSKMASLCEGIAAYLKEIGVPPQPLVVVLDVDLAKSVGNMLATVDQIKSPFICIDGIEPSDFDYIDLGLTDNNHDVITVTTKTLVFTG